MSDAVYLDYNATAPPLPAAIDAANAAMREFGNPSSVHAFGRRARARVEDARAAVAALIGAAPPEIHFTSGGTEANNLALAGFRDKYGGAARVLVGAAEHPSVLEAVDGAERLPVDGNGQIDLEALESALADEDLPTLISLMAANNETGIIQDVAAAAEIAHRHGALVHCDMVQAAGKVAMDVAAVDMASLSAHKIGGLQGAGALYISGRVSLAPRTRGGGQERGVRSGTEALPAIAGFGAAAAQAHGAHNRIADIEVLRDGLESRIAADVPDAIFIGAAGARLPNTSCIALPGVAADTQVMDLDLAGIAVSAGSACSSGKVKISHVLTAMGLAPDVASGAIRVSLGRDTTDAHIDRFLDVWTPLAKRLLSNAG